MVSSIPARTRESSTTPSQDLSGWTKRDYKRGAVPDTAEKVSLWTTNELDMQVLLNALRAEFEGAVLDSPVQKLVWTNTGQNEETRVGYKPASAEENSASLRFAVAVTVNGGSVHEKLKRVAEKTGIGEVIGQSITTPRNAEPKRFEATPEPKGQDVEISSYSPALAFG